MRAYVVIQQSPSLYSVFLVENEGCERKVTLNDNGEN